MASTYGDDANIDGTVTINESGADKDVRIEGDSEANLLFVDASTDRVGIGTNAPDYTLDVAGNIGVDEYIYHNGDANTLINLTDDKIILKAGGKAMITMEEKGSAPHEITLNDGANNIDFVVKGNGNGEGNPAFKVDASNNRVGINGIGDPEVELHVQGNIQGEGFLLAGETITATAALNASKALSKIFNSTTSTVGGVLPNPTKDGQIRVIVGMQGSSGTCTVAYTNLLGSTTTKTLTNGAGLLLISIDVTGSGTYRWCAVGDVS